MSALLLVVVAGLLLVAGYLGYGRWLAGRVFRLDPTAEVPSRALRDDRDYVPTSAPVVFGHHFTSIAGTGPIVGPALAIMWGWVPAVIWVLVGSILVGGMHDMAVLVVSLRNRGMTIGEVAGKLLNPRVRLLFLVLLLFALWIVLAIFGWVIASVFVQFPEATLPVFLQIPIAVAIGLTVHRRGGRLAVPSLLALATMYATVWLGAGCPGLASGGGWIGEAVRAINEHVAALPVWAWVAVLLAYCYVASVLPVWVLLQPRDYINSLQLVTSLGLVVAGLAAAAGVAGGEASPPLEIVAPAVNLHPEGAPPIVPFLFVTIACGAVSGFHCLVSSGTSSKHPGLTGAALWREVYGNWNGVTGGTAIAAFVVGSGNLLEAIGIEAVMARAMIGVLVASFAGTTLDTATRLQRYVVQELAGTLLSRHAATDRPRNGLLAWLTTPHGATLVAVLSAFGLALMPTPGKPWSWETIGTGGLILWPLFGATNQLLAGLSLVVIAFYLLRRGLPVAICLVPMVFMLVIPAWALAVGVGRWVADGSWGLAAVAAGMLGLEAWMVVEAVVLWPAARGVLEEAAAPATATRGQFRPTASTPSENQQ